MASFSGREVRVNIYDLHDCNRWLSNVGVGAYHTGIEIAGFEYSYSMQGIFKTQPRGAPEPARFKESVVLGVHSGSANDVSRIVNELREEFPPGSYDVLKKNCNVFSNALSLKLLGVEIPRYLNRLAGIGAFFTSGKKLQAMHQTIEDRNAGSAEARGGGSAAKGAAAEDYTKKKTLTDKQKELLAKMKKKKDPAGSAV